MKKYLGLCSLLILSSTTFNGFGQDFIRIGAAHVFQNNKIVQTFSFDFNRTERIDEKKGRFLFVDRNNFYVLPTTDINLGDGIKSSENNVSLQLNMGKAFYGDKIKSTDRLRTSVWNKAIEFNPSYSSDKLFQEKLAYGQVKFLINLISQKHIETTEDVFIGSVHSIAMGIVTNLGYRYSKTYETEAFYSTAGVLFEYMTRILNKNNQDIWIFRITGNYYSILSDVDQITTDSYAGLIKSSIDRLVFKNTFVSISHTYGNDNPGYNYVHTLELSARIKY
jgi:hypothetical protein